MLKILLQVNVVVCYALSIVCKRNEYQTPHQSHQVFGHPSLEVFVQTNVALGSFYQITGHLEARRVNETDRFVVKLAIDEQRTFAIVFCKSYELQSALEVKHVEVSDGDACKPINPSWMQLDSS